MILTIVARKKDGTIVPPRTKKNSPQILPHMKHPILVPSEAYREWHRAAVSSLIREEVCEKVADPATGEKHIAYALGEPVASPVNCRAIFYRDRLVGDSTGFYDGLADFLEDVGIVVNDKWLVSWDGSRLEKDAARPRIEVELTPAGAQGSFL